jgi:molybdopterin converting factor small subunit
MKLRVQYMGQLRTVAGKCEEEIELPDESSLAVVFHHLAQRLGREAAAHLFARPGEAHRSLLIVVNDSAVCVRDAAATALQCGDVITLLPPIAGG